MPPSLGTSGSSRNAADPGSDGLPAKKRVAAVEGMHTLDGEPHLIGAKIAGRETYFFPKHLAGGDPAVPAGTELEEVLLSRRGRVWSYTTSNYQPPAPFVAATDPYEPITVAAVELDKEKMVVLGQCVAGVTPDDLSIGSEVELVIDTLYEDDEHEYLVWKWKPVEVPDRAGTADSTGAPESETVSAAESRAGSKAEAPTR